MGHAAFTPNPNQQQNDIPVIIFIGTSWNSGELRWRVCLNILESDETKE